MEPGGANGGPPSPWGRRPYATAEARELLNDISRHIARERPSDVGDPSDPSLDEVIRHAPAALTRTGRDDDGDPKAQTLATLVGDFGLDYREAVLWYWFRYGGLGLTQIHYAITGAEAGGDPQERIDSIRNILGALQASAQAVPDASADDVPSMADLDVGGDGPD